MKPRDINSGLTQAYLLTILHYDPEDGLLYWIKPNPLWRAGKPGMMAGCLHKSTGYWVLKIDGVDYRAHRIIWVMWYGEWPEHEVDHDDGDKVHNRIGNLRRATHEQNSANKKRRVARKYPKGVDRLPGGRFRAKICVKYKQITIGTFDTPDAAHAAYLARAKKYFGNFATSG
jgi:HNH endonuclease/AP2 domain